MRVPHDYHQTKGWRLGGVGRWGGGGERQERQTVGQNLMRQRGRETETEPERQRV